VVDDDAVGDMSVTRKNISWNTEQPHGVQPTLHCKGTLPIGPVSSDSPIAYLQKTREESIIYVVQCDPKKQLNIILKELEQFIG
jgi:hypothetical protein